MELANVMLCFRWVGGEWSECSVTCGEGVQTREILCRQEITTTLVMTVADGACLTPPSPMLHRIRTCQRPPCAPASPPSLALWQVGLWSEVCHNNIVFHYSYRHSNSLVAIQLMLMFGD